MVQIPLFFLLFSIVYFPFPIRHQTSFGAIHHLADVGEALSPFGILGSTFTFAVSLFQHNSIHDRGSTIRHDILLDVGDGVTEAITDYVVPVCPQIEPSSHVLSL